MMGFYRLLGLIWYHPAGCDGLATCVSVYKTSISSSRLSKVRLMSPSTRFALLACVTVWVSNSSFSSTMMPRSLSSLTASRHVSHIPAVLVTRVLISKM